MSSNLQNNTGLFVPTTNVWDVDRIKDIDVNKPEFRELLVRLYQNINNICLVLNLKDSALYFDQEFINGQVLFPNPNTINAPIEGRQIFRLVVNFGPLPNTGTISIPHNLYVSGSYSFTRIYGVTTNPTSLSFLPIPYSSASSVANNIELSVDSVNVNITTGSNQSAYTTTYVILEYVKE